MSKNTNYDRFTAIERILRRLFEGRPSDEDIELIQGWLVNRENDDEIDAVLWKLFEDKVYYEEKPREELIKQLPRLRKKAGYAKTKRFTFRRAMVRFAAILTALIVAGGITLLVHRANQQVIEPTPQQTVSVVVEDKLQQLILPDSSVVTLAANSKLTYAEDFVNDRTVHLNGEGYFRVTRREGKPFTVVCEGMKIRVLGTEFSVHAVNEENTELVTLTSGTIEVTAGDQTTTLTPGQRLAFDKQHQSISLSEISEGTLMQLRGVPMNFDDETIGHIFEIVADYYNIIIEVQPGVDIQRRVIVPFSGTETIDDVMFILQNITNGFKYTITDNKVNVTK